MSPEELKAQFISLGQDESGTELQMVEDQVAISDLMNQIEPNDIVERELFFLIKGLVKYERSIARNSCEYVLGGSVSPTIRLCRNYAERYREKEAELIGWVVDKRINPFIPFGSSCYNTFRSYSEFDEFMREKNK